MLQLRAAHLPREPSTRPAHRVRPAPTPLRGGAVRRCNAYGPMAANESSGPSFYASEQESSATQVAVSRRICASSRFVSTRCRLHLSMHGNLAGWTFESDKARCFFAAVRGLRRIDSETGSFPTSRTHRTRSAMPSHGTHAARTVRHACTIAGHFEMASSAMPFVRGPMNPIAAITITIAPAMNANTPKVPKPFSTAAITNDEKIAEKRLHE